MNLDDFIVGSLEGPPDPEAAERVADDPEAAALAPVLASQRELLAEPETWAELPPALEDAVVGAIAAERDGDVVPLEAARSGSARRARRRPSPWWSAVPAAAAAAVVAVVVIAGGDDGGPTRPAVEVELAGTELAPEASGRADLEAWSSGVRVDLDVEGLPPAEPGFYYQAWVVGPSGSVALGSFHLHGGETVVLWSGVEAEAGVVLSITREPDDGDASPSGQRVLSGTVQVDLDAAGD